MCCTQQPVAMDGSALGLACPSLKWALCAGLCPIAPIGLHKSSIPCGPFWKPRSNPRDSGDPQRRIGQARPEAQAVQSASRRARRRSRLRAGSTASAAPRFALMMCSATKHERQDAGDGAIDRCCGARLTEGRPAAHAPSIGRRPHHSSHAAAPQCRAADRRPDEVAEAKAGADGANVRARS